MSEHVNEPSRRAFVFAAATLGTAFASGMLSINPSHAFAVTAAEKQAEADAVRDQLVSLQADLELCADRYYAALEAVDAAIAERDAAHEAMEAEQVKIDETTARIEEIQDRLGDRVRSMYRTGPSGFLDFVLGATTFEEFTTNWGLLGTINDEDARLIDEARELREELEAAKAEYERQEQIAQEKADAADAARADAELARNEASARVAEATELMNNLEEEDRVLLEQEQAEAARRAAEAAAAEAAARQAAEAAAAAAAAGEGGVEDGGDGGDGGAVVSTPVYTAPTAYTSGAPVGDYSSVVDYALSRKGCPYVWGAEGPDSFDCSGLVKWAYAQVGIDVPHYTESLFATAANRVPVSEARPGDVLYRYGHVGIAVGYGGEPYVHAPTFGAVVRDTDPLSWSGFTHALQFM